MHFWNFIKRFVARFHFVRGRQRLALSHTQLVTDDDRTVECYQPHTGRTAHTDTHKGTHRRSHSHTRTHSEN